MYSNINRTYRKTVKNIEILPTFFTLQNPSDILRIIMSIDKTKKTKNIQEPDGERLKVQIYMYINEGEYLYAYQIYKSLCFKNHSSVYKYFKWANELGYVEILSETIKNRTRVKHKLNESGLKYCRQQMERYGIPLSITLQELIKLKINIKAIKKQQDKELEEFEKRSKPQLRGDDYNA